MPTAGEFERREPKGCHHALSAERDIEAQYEESTELTCDAVAGPERGRG
jgi:hypothetical protein